MPRHKVELLSKEIRYSDLFGAMSFVSDLASREPLVIALDPRPVRDAATGLYFFFIPRFRIELACRRIKEHFAALGETVVY